MVAQRTESSTVTPAVNALRRYFLAHGQHLPVEHAERIHALVVRALLFQPSKAGPDKKPNWRFDAGGAVKDWSQSQRVIEWAINLGIAPGSAKDVAYRRLMDAWYEEAAHIRSMARIHRQDGRARLQAWFDAGCPLPSF